MGFQHESLEEPGDGAPGATSSERHRAWTGQRQSSVVSDSHSRRVAARTCRKRCPRFRSLHVLIVWSSTSGAQRALSRSSAGDARKRKLTLTQKPVCDGTHSCPFALSTITRPLTRKANRTSPRVARLGAGVGPGRRPRPQPPGAGVAVYCVALRRCGGRRARRNLTQPPFGVSSGRAVQLCGSGRDPADAPADSRHVAGVCQSDHSTMPLAAVRRRRSRNPRPYRPGGSAIVQPRPSCGALFAPGGGRWVGSRRAESAVAIEA